MDNENRLKPSDRVDKIAELIRSLTYGEMIELASGLREAAGGTETMAGTLPIILRGLGTKVVGRTLLGGWEAYLMMRMIMIAGLAVAGPRARRNIRSVSRADQRHSHRQSHD